MWLKRPHLKDLLNIQKSLRAFFSSGGAIPKPNLNYPGGSNKIGAYGYFLLVSIDVLISYQLFLTYNYLILIIIVRD